MVQWLRGRLAAEHTSPDGQKTLRLKRRAPGCSKAMPPESENGLRKEMAYYEAKGRIVPSARRLDNPFDRSEEPLRMPGQDGELWP